MEAAGSIGRAVRVPKTIVFGASGFLGRNYLTEHRKIHRDAIGTVRGSGDAFFDLARPDIRPLRLAGRGFENALIAAAVTDVRKCEEQRDQARRINVEGTLELVRQLADMGIKPIFLSSDYVFDGKAGRYADLDPTNPITEYGRHKAEVEACLPGICGDRYLVLRLSKVTGVEPGDKTLIDQIASALLAGRAISAARDQVYCPTFVGDIVRVAAGLQSLDASGIFNVAAPEALSRLQISRRIGEAMGVDPALIKDFSINEMGESFTRPKRTDMVCHRVAACGDFSFHTLDQCIAMYLTHQQEREAG